MRVFQSEIDALSDLTVEELEDRLQLIEKMGARTKQWIEDGDLGNFVGEHIEYGRWVNSFSNQVALNVQRKAWSVTKAALKQRKKEKFMPDRWSFKSEISLPCSCGGTMKGDGIVATGKTLPSGYKPEPNEILKIGFIQCDKCGEWQAS